MDFLSNLYAIESGTDIFIVKFGLFISLLLLLPFLSILTGSLFFSLLHVTKSKVYNNVSYLAFAKYQIEVITNRMWVRLFFGVLPFFFIAFFYSQLYTTSSFNIPENLFYAFLLFLVGLCISVLYKNSFKIKEVNDAIESGNIDIKKLNNSKSKFLQIGGWIAFLLLLISSFILIGYLKLAIIPNSMLPSSIMEVLFSVSSIAYYLLFLSISFSITSAIQVARMNRTKFDYIFKKYSKDFSTKTGMLFTFIQPLIFVLNLLSVNSHSLSFALFISSIFVLLFMLIISIQFYLNYRDKNLKSTSIVFAFMLLFVFLIYNVQISSERAHKKEAVKSGKILEIFS